MPSAVATALAMAHNAPNDEEAFGALLDNTAVSGCMAVVVQVAVARGLERVGEAAAGAWAGAGVSAGIAEASAGWWQMGGGT